MRELNRLSLATAVVVSLLCLSTPAQAGYLSALGIKRFRIHNGQAWLRVDAAPSGTCTNYTDQFAFDPSTTLGKQTVAALLLAQAAGRQITLWYTDSTAPGTSEMDGCSFTSAAKITGIAVVQP